MYEILIRLYGLGIRFAALFNSKARSWTQGRTDYFEHMREGLRQRGMLNPDTPIYWFHCSSLGEFEQGRPLIEALRAWKPDAKILLTFFSPSGYDKRKDYPVASYVCYLPLDTSANAKKFVEMVNPGVAIFVKYEFWFNLLHELHRRNVVTLLVSAIFRPEQYFFKAWGAWPRKVLGSYSRIFVQDALSLQLLKQAGITAVSVSGDTRFDRVAAIREHPTPNPTAAAFANGHTVIVAGSTWPPDEALLQACMPQLPLQIKLLLAPHEITEAKLKLLESQFGSGVARLSESSPETAPSARVLLVDSIGQLSSLYQYGSIAYIGGGFGAGIHNVLEPAAFGLPVLMGPKIQKFLEARELQAQSAAFVIQDESALRYKIEQLFTDKELLAKASATASAYVSEHTGATATVMDYLRTLD